MDQKNSSDQNQISEILNENWVKSSKLQLPEDEQIIIQSHFQLIQENKQHQCELILYENKIYLQNEQKVIAILFFSFELIFELLVQNTEEFKKGNIQGFKFIKNKLETVFSTDDKSLYIIWHQALKKKLIQNKFDMFYEFKKLVGTGANSNVYIGQNKQNNNMVAIKSINKQEIQKNHQKKHEIESELQIMRSINNSKVLQLIEVFQTENAYKIIMELVQGGTLQDYITSKASNQLTWNQIASILQQILQGLQAMHNLNIMHRDLKPENILLRDKNELDLVIADLGFAIKKENYEQQNALIKCGTPGFVAPEVLSAKTISNYDCLCDCFSAGCILYRICFGRGIFEGNTHTEVLEQNRICTINFEGITNMPPQALKLLKDLLEVNPANRINAEKALNHSFFQELQQFGKEINKSTCQFPKEIKTACRRATIQVIGIRNEQKKERKNTYQEFGNGLYEENKKSESKGTSGTNLQRRSSMLTKVVKK